MVTLLRSSAATHESILHGLEKSEVEDLRKQVLSHPLLAEFEMAARESSGVATDWKFPAEGQGIDPCKSLGLFVQWLASRDDVNLPPNHEQPHQPCESGEGGESEKEQAFENDPEVPVEPKPKQRKQNIQDFAEAGYLGNK